MRPHGTLPHTVCKGQSHDHEYILGDTILVQVMTSVSHMARRGIEVVLHCSAEYSSNRDALPFQRCERINWHDRKPSTQRKSNL